MQTTLSSLSQRELIMLVKSQEGALEQKGQTIQKQDQLIQQREETIQEQEASIKQYQADITYYKAQIAQFQRMLFGQKRERFEGQGSQPPLPFEAEPEQVQQQQEELTEKITYVRRKQSKHKGRLPLPDHLPVEEVEIHPDGNLEEMVRIGKEITDELEFIPGKFFIRRYIRYKYAPKDKQKEGVLMGDLPERVIDKGIPGFGLLASILVDKYMDHLPLYRQRQRFLREGIPICSSTLEGWVKKGLERIEILYDYLVADTKSKGYLQADETPIRVLESNTKGKTHQGYYWVYHNPIDKTVLFDYQPNLTTNLTEQVRDRPEY